MHQLQNVRRRDNDCTTVKNEKEGSNELVNSSICRSHPGMIRKMQAGNAADDRDDDCVLMVAVVMAMIVRLAVRTTMMKMTVSVL